MGKGTPDDTPADLEAKTRKRKRKRKSRKQEHVGVDSGQLSRDEKEVPPKTCETERTTQVERTVFVEGIPFHASPDDVKGFFMNHEVDDIEDCRLPQWQDSGRLRGYGHVVFKSKASRDKAIGLSGKYLQNRYLSIAEARAPRDPFEQSSQSEPSNTILLQNLAYDATEEDIEKVLGEYGEISRGGARVVRHSANDRRSKGFAYVQFEDIESAKRVMQEKIVVLNRPCRMDYDHGRVKGSFRAADGRLWHSNQRRRATDA